MKAEAAVGGGDAARIKKAVKEINFGGWEEKEAAAVEIMRLAQEDAGTRRLLAELGVIPALVAMAADANADRCRRLAVAALIEMANGTFRNKKLMVEAGLLSKLPQLLHTQPLAGDRQLALLIFSISSLAKTNFPVDPSYILPFLIETLNAQEIYDEAKLTSLATLHNLSAKLENTKPISESGAVHALLISSAHKRASEVALATLGNLVLSSAGRKAIEDDPLVPDIFVEILAWEDKPKCQELVAHLLMVIAHRSAAQRQKMKELGIIPVLLEVALLGSSIARKRALKLMEWFKDEKQMRMGAHSGPQAQRFDDSSSPAEEEDDDERRRAVKGLVKQSLDKNMELIVRRANGHEGCSGLKVLVATSSSKSLPY